MPHVTFIHGIANKPDHDRLLSLWRQALAAEDGLNLGAKGVTSSMVYWADVMYAEPAQDGETNESVGAEMHTQAMDEDLDWTKNLSAEESAFCKSLSQKLNFDAESPGGDDYQPPEPDADISYSAQPSVADVRAEFEAIPLPWFIKRRLMKALLKDVHHYLFNAEFSPRSGDVYQVQDEIRRRFVETLKQDAANNQGGPHVVVSHSMGTVISYDCLKRVPDCPAVAAYLTLGSPLGLEEVQHKLAPEWTRVDGFPREKMAGDWVNIYDRLDPVAFDSKLANDYKLQGAEKVHDEKVRNDGKWRHDIAKYLARTKTRDALKTALGI